MCHFIDFLCLNAIISYAGLKDCMKKGYSFLEGVEELLYGLRQNNYEMHAFTNYPNWLNKHYFRIILYLPLTTKIKENKSNLPFSGNFILQVPND